MGKYEEVGTPAADTASAPNQQPASEVDVASSKRTISPAFQLYAAEFLAGDKVTRMSYTEIGIFTVLLCHAWTANGLPTNVTEIAKKLKIHPPRFLKMWRGVLSECWIEKGGRLINPRQEIERKKQRDYRDKQRNAAASRWHKPEDASGMPKAGISSGNALQSSSSSSSSSSEVHVHNDEAFRTFQAVYPEGRRKGGPLVEQLFLQALGFVGGLDPLLAALENHLASEQWQTPKLIPGMDTWFLEQRWRQRLTAPQTIEQLPRERWQCPHVTRCANADQCRQATILGRPRKADA